MADYRKLAINLIAADGDIDATEVRVLKKELYADGRISHDEVTFIGEVRAAVLAKAKGKPTTGIDKFFLNAFHESVLGNGIISLEEVDMVKKLVLEDKKLVHYAKKFLDNLKAKATQIPPEFDALYGHIPAKKPSSKPKAAAKPAPAPAKAAPAKKKKKK
jgi:hypothetical protein